MKKPKADEPKKHTGKRGPKDKGDWTPPQGNEADPPPQNPPVPPGGDDDGNHNP